MAKKSTSKKLKALLKHLNKEYVREKPAGKVKKGKIKILVLGSGGRENTIVWKLLQSPKTEKVFCMPGNAGISRLAECVNIDLKDFEQLARFVKDNNIGLTVVGPESPLADGIVDYFNKNSLRIFGPNKKAAQLESSKAFSKYFMQKHDIPTARFEIFGNYEDAMHYLDNVSTDLPVKKFSVVKADGLCAGKGVKVCTDFYDVRDTVRKIFEDRIFGDAGKKVVIEEKLEGQEASLMAFCDGKTVMPMIPSQDHKSVFENGKGPNTGGMGAYAPAPLVTKELVSRAKKEVFDRFLKGCSREKIEFKGIIYAGIMLTAEKEIKVLEFNVRFGDPETECVLPLLKTDLVDIMNAVIDGKLKNTRVVWDKGSCVCVVLASGGYPGKYETGKVISGLEEAGLMKDVVVFHSGTKLQDGSIVTAGGRVLGVTGWDKFLQNAIDRTYNAVRKINFDGVHYRRDIGVKGLRDQLKSSD